MTEKQRVEAQAIAEEIAAKIDEYYAEQRRDLAEDLAICEAATPGPWKVADTTEWTYVLDEDDDIVGACERAVDADFTAEAREGWPAAIRRAQAAEAEVERLERRIKELTESNAYYIDQNERADDLLYEILDDHDCAISTRELIEERTDIRD